MSNKPMITLDLKKSRVRIHKSTLELMGNPDHIHILVNPTERKLIIRPTIPDEQGSIKIMYTTETECEIYGDLFLQRLSKLLPQNDPEHSYRICGRMMRRQNSALFDLQKATACDSPMISGENDTVRSDLNE